MVAVICWWLTTATFPAGWPPISTVAAGSKFVPEIVTAVPPAAGPLAGVMEKGRRCENEDVCLVGPKKP